ncbi:MAG: ABC transporter substrate-binding protein [Galactobacter sp.]
MTRLRHYAAAAQARNKVRRGSTIALAALALTSATTLTSCGDPASDAGTDPADRTITYAHQQEPMCVFGGWIEQAYLSYQVLDQLTALDEDKNAVPWLATSWESSEDGLTWTLKLKDGVKFTDGTAVDAQAVADNFDYWIKDSGNSTAAAWIGSQYESAQAEDEHTVRINLKSPYPRLPETLAQGYFGIQSAHALKNRTQQQNCEQPIGSGAFTVDHWNRGQNIVLKRNENYTSWPANAKHQGPAKVAAVNWKFVPDATTRSSALKAGEVDAIYDVPSIDWQDLGEAGFQRLKYVTGGRPQQLTFNTKQGIFTDQNVRQAFAYSLDREPLVEAVGRGVIPAEGNGSVSQSSPGYSEKAADRYPFDLDKANELLDEAGWTERDEEGYRTKDGKVLEVKLPYGAGTILNAEGGEILQGVAQQVKKSGFKVDLNPVPPAQWWGGSYGTPDKPDIYPGYWTAIGAGILWINWAPEDQHPYVDNSAFYEDKLLAKIISDANAEADEDQQNALYRQAQDYIADRALAVGLYDRLSTLAVSTNLHDVWQENAQGGPVFHDAHFEN